MWDIVVGIVAIVLGLVLVFAGLRFFFAALPILGFILGFLVGGAGVEAIFGDGIFSTLTSWIVGLILGLIFAAISYLWWYAGALIAAGSTGAALGTALVSAFGSNAHWLIFLFAAIGFVLFFVVAFVLALPIYIVLVNTAFVGATIVIAGLLLVIDKINRNELWGGNVVAIINESWWWTIPLVVLAAAGIFSQMSAMATIALPDERWTTATPR
ncbi:MAG: DUF4203 domain-containing protein [Thermomicrobiales bacterium]